MGKTKQQNIISDQLFGCIKELEKSEPYFKGLLQSVRSGTTEVSLIRQDVNKHILLEWIEAIEASLVALDNAIRLPARYIEERDEVKPIELSHSIRPRSLIHLAQHTDYISEVKEDTVTPNKILNVYNEETILTYENRFVNTLVHRLYVFVNTRYLEMVSKGMENGSILSFKSSFNDAGYNGKVDLTVSISEPTNKDGNSENVAIKRAGQLNSIMSMYMNSEFIKSMGDNFVHPPIQRTNALLKNKNLKTCLDLWQFIEGYDKVGYTISVERKAESPDDELINKLFDDMALQYATFKHEIANIDEDIMVVDEDAMTIEPLVNAEFPDIDVHEFDIYDSEYRRLAPVDRSFVADEARFNDEIYKIVSDDYQIDKLLSDDYNPYINALKSARSKLLILSEQEEERLREEEKQRILKEEMEFFGEGEESLNTYRLDRSFMAKFIQSNDDTKDFYGILKNKLLSYKKVSDRISWHYECFNIGRNNFAKFRMRGKTLCLCLQLNPKDFADSKYKVEAVSGKKYATTPLLYKINNYRRCRYALELIDLIAEKLALQFDSMPEIDYYMPYEENDQLISEGLIKEIGVRGGATFTVDDLPEKQDSPDDSAKPDESAPADNQNAEPQQDNSGFLGTYRLDRSFMAKLIQANDDTKGFYSQLKNKLLSYNKVHDRTSWHFENFNIGRNNIAKLRIRGKTLYIYLQLSVADFADSKFKVEQASGKKYATTELAYKVNNNLRCKNAIELIDIMADKLGLQSDSIPEIDYYMPYEDDDKLIAEGLIKEIGEKGGATFTVDDLKEKPVAKPTDNVVSDTVETESAESVEPVEPVEPVESVKSVDTESAQLEQQTPFVATYRLDRSFMAKLIQANDDTKGFYSQLKNKLLSYNKVHDRTSWHFENFNIGRNNIAKLRIRGKTLYIYLQLSVADFTDSKFKVEQASGKKYATTELAYKVNNNLRCKNAIELIDIMADKLGLTFVKAMDNDYSMPYKDDDTLLAEGLIKQVELPSVSFLNDKAVAQPVATNDEALDEVAATSDVHSMKLFSDNKTVEIKKDIDKISQNASIDISEIADSKPDVVEKSDSPLDNSGLKIDPQDLSLLKDKNDAKPPKKKRRGLFWFFRRKK